MPRGGHRVGAGRKRTRPPAAAKTTAPAAPPLETLKPEVTPVVRGTGTRDELTPKERRFVEEYLIDMNASAAYLRAGYKGKDPYARASELRSKPRVAAAIDRAMAERSKRVHVDQDRVIAELARIAFADRRKFFERFKGEPVKPEHFYNACRNPEWSLPWDKLTTAEQEGWTKGAELLTERTRNGFFAKDPDEFDDDLAAAFEGVEITEKKDVNGEVERIRKITSTPKIPALTLLGKHLGMWHDKGAPTGAKEREVDEKATDNELIARAEELIAKARERVNGTVAR